MKISIALATYNGSAYLQDQLDSYLTQVRKPDEIVVCDDVSTDDSIKILETFKDIAPFQVRITKNNKNLGYTKNFEKALSLCTGDIIFFSDQDDIWFPDKISLIENIFNYSPDTSLLIHDGEIVDEHLNSTGLTKLGQIRSGGYSDESFVTGALSAVRKDILHIILPFPDGISGGHDGWVHTISRLVGRRMLVNNVLQKLRRHPYNTSEWVASSTEKIKKFDVLVSQLKTIPATNYADRLFYNESLSKRFKDIEYGLIPCLYSIEHKKIQKNLKNERYSLLRRERLILRGFWGKKISAVSMLLAGNYSHFNGVRSFFRDFLRIT